MPSYTIRLRGCRHLARDVYVMKFDRPSGFTFLPDFLRALQHYYDSYYIMLNLPIP